MQPARADQRNVPAALPGRVLPRYSTIRTVIALCLREVTTSNGDMAGGYLWSIISPVIFISGLAIIFSAGFRAPPLGENFAIFYATGMLPFTMFRQVCARLEHAIRSSRNLLNFPRVTLFDVLLSKLIMSVLTQAAVSVVVLGLILQFYETNTRFFAVEVLKSFAVAAALGCGVGLANCAIRAKFPLWDFIWSFLSRPLLLVSGIIILVESLPRPYGEWLLWNPLVHITGRMREAFYVDYIGSYADLWYPMQIALVLTFAGLAGIRLFARELLDQ
ncbi:ABC transporter permease [Paracoccus aerodenitrificans]|uniref:ABC transporter permease n=1 Tax=Paracoccus aerodenitrificans TaxID=3017781 RepID=UPI0022F038BC|nr:ABC transporter permease [Paracoccus aerodenitrificans]WBU65735.1 ABC transporter permease [Paracoccus aerodenitrificans]